MKRLRDGIREPSEPPGKRHQLAYPQWPSDSPSNPFRRQRIQALPSPTSFSKHVALRFQFVRPGIGQRVGGVYRIVQVPLSYSFVHLRCLIAFLFNGDCSEGSGYGSGQILFPEKDAQGHLFEVQKDVLLYNMAYKPGQIKSGITSLKCSCARDPCRFATDEESEDEDGVEQDDWKWEDEDQVTLGHAWPRGLDLSRAIIYHHSRMSQIHIIINKGWLPRRRGRSNIPFVFRGRGRVWLDPPPVVLPSLLHDWFYRDNKRLRDLTDPGDDSPAPQQPVSSGGASADQPFSPPVIDLCSPFTSPEKPTMSNLLFKCLSAERAGREFGPSHPYFSGQDDTQSKENMSRSDYDLEGGPKSSIDEDDWKTEDHDADFPLEECNLPDAFPEFFARFMRLQRRRGGGSNAVSYSPGTIVETQCDDAGGVEDDDELVFHPSSTPGVSLPSTPSISVRASSSVPSSSVRGSSSPACGESSLDDEDKALSQLSDDDTFVYYPLPFTRYNPTPAPPHALCRRIARVQKRIDHSKRGKWICAADDVEDDGETREVEELPEDGDVSFVMPTLKDGETWDPFGDESEI